MLKSMREGMKPVMWGVAIAFTASLFILGAGTAGKLFTEDKEKTILTVNGTEIVEKDFIERFEMEYSAIYRNYIEQAGQSPDDETYAALEDQALASTVAFMIERQLMLDEADKLNVVVTDWEVKNLIMNNEAFQTDGEFDATLYERMVTTQLGIKTVQYEEEVRFSLVLNRLSGIISETARVSDTELREYFNDTQSPAEAIFVRFPIAGAERPKLSEKEVAAYYEAHKEDYHHPEQISLKYILLNYEEISNSIEVTEDEIKKAYEDSKFDHLEKGEIMLSHILITPKAETPEAVEAARATAVELKTMLDAGADFAELANGYSDDPGSAAKGGELGWVGRGMMVYEFEEAAFYLESGTISDPVLTQFGWHLIKRGADFEPYEVVKADLESKIQSKKISDTATNKANELHTLIGNGQAIEEVGKAQDYEVTTSAYFAYNGEFEDYGNQPILSMEAFIAEKGELGSLYPLNTIIQGLDFTIPIGYLIWVVDDMREPGTMPFEEIEELVTRDAEDAKILNGYQSQAKEFYKASKAKDADFVAVAASMELMPETTGKFTRSQPPMTVGDDNYFVKAVFDAKKGEVVGPIRSSQAYYVIKVVNKEKLGESDFIARKDTLKDEITRTNSNKLLADWQTNLRLSAEVEDFSTEWLERLRIARIEGPESPMDFGGGLGY